MAAANAGQVIALARQYLGTPYVWGGSSPQTGFDCSGLIQYIYAQSGIHLPRTTFDQVNSGIPVGKSQLKPGDILFFEPTKQGPGHEGLYIGGGQFIEAPHTGADVRVATLAGRSDYVTARRVIPVGSPSLGTTAKVAAMVTNTAPAPAAAMATVKAPPPYRQTTTPSTSAMSGGSDVALQAYLANQQRFTPPTMPAGNPQLDITGAPSAALQQALAAANRYTADTGATFTGQGFAKYLHGADQVPSNFPALLAAGQPADQGSHQPGDLLLFGKPLPSHAGVAVGDGTFLHGADGGIRVSSHLSPAYSPHLVAVRNFG